MNGGWPGGRNPLISMSSKFSMSSVFFHEFGKFCEICEFGRIRELQETWGFCNFCSGTGYTIGLQAVRKTVWCTACFALSLVALSSYETVFIPAHEFYLLSIPPPHPAGEEGKG